MISHSVFLENDVNNNDVIAALVYLGRNMEISSNFHLVVRVLPAQ